MQLFAHLNRDSHGTLRQEVKPLRQLESAHCYRPARLRLLEPAQFGRDAGCFGPGPGTGLADRRGQVIAHCSV